MSKSTNMATLLNFADLTARTMSNHTKLCSANVKVCRIPAKLFLILWNACSLLFVVRQILSICPLKIKRLLIVIPSKITCLLSSISFELKLTEFCILLSRTTNWGLLILNYCKMIFISCFRLPKMFDKSWPQS